MKSYKANEGSEYAVRRALGVVAFAGAAAVSFVCGMLFQAGFEFEVLTVLAVVPLIFVALR